MSTLTTFGLSTFVVLLGALLYQTQLLHVIRLGYGLGKDVEPISSFPYQCRQIKDPRLQACEDMWLSEDTRQLFLACSDSLGRKHWHPNAGHLNATGRSLRDALVVLDIDKPDGDGFQMHSLSTPGFKGELHLSGMSVNRDSNGDFRFWLVNSKPVTNETTGEVVSDSKVADQVVELFRLPNSKRAGVQATKLEHLKTFSDSRIATANRVAAVSSKDDVADFWLTNDHGLDKTGLWNALSPYFATADVTICREDSCFEAAPNLKYPNGLVKGPDGLIYVPSSITGGIHVFKIDPTYKNKLRQIEYIYTEFGLDNISVDRNGDLWIAAFPVGLKMLKSAKDPLNSRPPSAALRVRKMPGFTWEVEKIIEDAKGEVLPGSTTVVHDVQTGRLFFTGAFSPFIAVCEKRN